MSRKALLVHAAWAGQLSSFQSDAPRRSWVPPAIVHVGITVGAQHLYYYRLKNRLTVLEMVGKLGNCVSSDDLRQIELGRRDVPTALANWLAQ
jgi:hypothetical protein